MRERGSRKIQLASKWPTEIRKAADSVGLGRREEVLFGMY